MVGNAPSVTILGSQILNPNAVLTANAMALVANAGALQSPQSTRRKGSASERTCVRVDLPAICGRLARVWWVGRGYSPLVLMQAYALSMLYIAWLTLGDIVNRNYAPNVRGKQASI